MAKTLDDYKREQRDLERKIATRKSNNARISGEIKRLEAAYKKLGNIKSHNADNADKVRNDAKLNKVAGGVEWKGDSKNLFDDVMTYNVLPAAKDFYKSIDDIHDEIGRALDRKRGEYDTGIGILNGLNRSWNNVVGIIRNWVN